MRGLVPKCVVLMTFFVVFSIVNAETDVVKRALVQFMKKLSPGNAERGLNWGWNETSDPCTNKWKGVTCDENSESVKRIVLEQLNLTGVFDASSLCVTTSLYVLSLNGNNVSGNIAGDISNCRHLTHLYLRGNRLSGNLPSSLSLLTNLRRIDISNNNFSGQLPNLSKISELLTFLVENNQLSGALPSLNFSQLKDFNVSCNNFSGPIPNVGGHFFESSFLGNPELCGKPLSKICPPPPPPPAKKKSFSKKKFFIYSGYAILGLIIVILCALILLKRKTSKTEKREEKVDSSSSKSTTTPSVTKPGENRSEFSITSIESGSNSTPLVVLSSPVVKGLRFEDLLRAPAELVGRGKHGSVYKVILNGDVTLAVKRIKALGIPRDDFNRRMQRIDQVRHPNVMPIIAYYTSKQEKLLVYEYQQNGSLFKLLHGSQNGEPFGWASRLNVAARIAGALAFMHEALKDDGIAHGNIKSSNILLNKDMDPCISEYGLMVVEYQDSSSFSQSENLKDRDSTVGRPYSTFKVDIYAFGIVLLELLTGKIVQNSGYDLSAWVNSVVREEWTAEVFDKALVLEGASEERMFNLLQVAMKCINPSPGDRPSLGQVAAIISSIKEEEQRSSLSSGSHYTSSP